MSVEQALVWLKTPDREIPDARLYGFPITRRDGIVLPFRYNGRLWGFSHTHQETDLKSGVRTVWLVFTEQGAAQPADPAQGNGGQL